MGHAVQIGVRGQQPNVRFGQIEQKTTLTGRIRDGFYRLKDKWVVR